MLSIVKAALRSRRLSMVAPRSDPWAQPGPLVHVCAADAIAALAVGFAAAAPGCVAAFGRGHAAAGLVIVAATTTAVVLLFAALAIRLVVGLRRSVPDAPGARPPRRGRRFPGGSGAGAVGAIGGLAIGGGVASTGAMDLVPFTIGVGIASAAVAVAACRAGAYLGSRRAIGLRRATDRRLVPGWLVAAGALVALAAIARHVGPVGADLVPYVVAAAVALGIGGMLRPVARWIGCRAVRVTEFVVDERPYVRVDGGAGTASKVTARGDAGPDEAVDESPAGARATSRFVRGTIAATGYLARRPDLDHVVALAAAGVVIAGAATLAWTSGVTARHDRAAIELGADRVVSVAPVPPAHLVAAVRAADPTGRFAMAAVVAPASAAGGEVVAVDGQRLGAVVSGNVRSGPTGTQLAAMLRPTRVSPTVVTGATLQLNVITSSTVSATARVAVLLKTPDEVTRRAEFGPLRPGAHVYAAAAPCQIGCTVVGFTVAGNLALTQPVVSVILRELHQRTPDRAVLDASAFADASRWRLGPVGASGAPTYAVSGAGLDIAVAADSAPSDGSAPSGRGVDAVLYLDAGAPTSAIAGPETTAGRSYDLPPAEAGALKITRLRSPVLGVPAGGILVDVRDGAPPDAGATSEVWLASDAPPSFVDDLSRYGLRIVADTSVAELAAAYADQPAVAVARFQLMAGIVTLCFAALLIGAVARAHRGVRTVARGVGLAIAAWTAGITGALVARHAGPDFATSFVDGWARVAPPPLVGSTPFAGFALVSGLVFAAAVAVVGAGRPNRSGVVNPPGPARPLDGRVAAGGRERTDLTVGGAHGTVSARDG